MMHIVIPWEQGGVSKNNKYTRWSGGRIALTAEYRDAKEAITEVASDQIGNLEAYDQHVNILIIFHMPDKRHRDIFNYTQIVFDGLEGVAYTDDWHIDYATVVRGPVDRENPRIEVYIHPTVSQYDD